MLVPHKMQSKLIRFLTILLTLSAATIFLSFQSNTGKGEAIGKISFPLNRVFVIPAGTASLKYARFNMEVFNGDKIETKKESRCEITLNSGDVIRIDENTIFTLENVRTKGDTVRVEANLSLGKLWANIKKMFGGDDYFKVKSPTAVIAVRGTKYRVDADSATTVRVYEGEVSVKANAAAGIDKPMSNRPGQIAPPRQVAPPQEVTVEEWLQIVKAQQQLVVTADGSMTPSEFDAAADADLDWVKWNLKRDRLLHEKNRE